MAMIHRRLLGDVWGAGILAGALMFAALAPRPCSAQDVSLKGRVFALPMDYEPLRIPFPIVHVKINGSEPLPFVLDTGCSVAVVVTETTQRHLQLTMASEHTSDSVHTSVRYKEVRLESAKLCGARPANDIELSSNSGLRASILPGKIGNMLEQYKIAGLIGVPLLRPFSVARLDFSRKMLILGLYGDLTDVVKDAAELPISQQADGRLHVTAGVGADGKADMVVDTGSPSTLLSDDLAYQAGFTLTDTSAYANVGGTHRVYSGVLSRLELGKFSETNVDCEVPTGEPNLLGADLLSRYLVTFDLGGSKMYLTRGPEYDQRSRTRGAESISLVQKDGRLLVGAITPGSAAALAGVQKGDDLISVNGVNVQQMTVASVHLLLNGYVGDNARLDLVRNGDVVHTSYTVESPAAGSSGGQGVKVTLIRGGKLVFPDSAGVTGAGRTATVEPGQTVTITPGTTIFAAPYTRQ